MLRLGRSRAKTWRRRDAGDTVLAFAGDGRGDPSLRGRRRDPNSPLPVLVYPDGMDWDIRRGYPAERDEVAANIRAVPLPGADPVLGPGGPIDELWRPER